MAANENVSVDEFLSARKAFVKSGDVLMKAAVNPPASWNKDARTARFVMSAEVEDRDKDIVVQQGLGLGEFLKNPIAPFQHKSGEFPVGNWDDVQQNLTGRPKRTEGTLKLVPEGQDGVADRLAFHIGAGTIRACSIGFIPKTIKRREQSQPTDGYAYSGYMIEEADLLECSPVSIPANPAALAKAAASGDTIARDLIEETLDLWVRNPANGLIMPRADFEKAYREAAGDKSVVVLGGKTFTLTEVAAPVETPEDSFLKRLEGSLTKFFGQSTVPVAPAAPVEKETPPAESAADRASRLRNLELRSAVIEARVGVKTAA